jgi:taurine--2-oxoglutarate transaminase
MSEKTTQTFDRLVGPIDWGEIEHWDRTYYLHNVQAQAEYVFTGVERTDGNYLYLADGTRLLDFQSQLVSDSMGHRHPKVHAEIKRAMERYGHVFFGLATDYRARAAKLVIEDILGGKKGWAGRVRFLSSGSEGVECALAMARLYTGRPVILTQAHSFHGMTIGATQLRGYRGNITPVESPDEVRDVPGFPGPGIVPIPAPEFHDWVGGGPLPSLVATERIIQEVGPENIAAVITETMLGAAGYLPHDRYLVELYGLSRKYDFLWIDDEVMCGFGRLGDWFGYQGYDGIEPDLMPIGKSINGCALPAGGVVASRPIAEYFDRARWWSGSTHDAHALVCASIVGNLETMIEEDIIARVRRLSPYLEAKLRDVGRRHACVGRIAGRGFYFCVDLVDAAGNPIVTDDRDTGFVGDIASHPNHVIARECAKRGLYLGGFVPNTIKVAPPFTITEEEIDFGIGVFDEALAVIDRQIGVNRSRA